VKSPSEGLVVGSFGFDGLFDTVFEALSDVYQRHLVFIGTFVISTDTRSGVTW